MRMNVISHGYEFITDDAGLVAAVKAHEVSLKDFRKNSERDVAHRKGITPDSLRILTVSTNCSFGKMIISLELACALQKRGFDVKYAATDQTGILIEGDGIPIDAVMSDFIKGAVEKLVLQN